MRTFEDNVDSLYIDAYKKAYEDRHIELKNEEFKAKGYTDGIINKPNKNIDEKFKNSYEEGYKKGNKDRNEMLESAYNQGYEGETLKIDKKFEPIKSEIESKYNEGKKTSKNDKVAVAGIIVVGGTAGFTIYKKKKSKRNS